MSGTVPISRTVLCRLVVHCGVRSAPPSAAIPLLVHLRDPAAARLRVSTSCPTMLMFSKTRPRSCRTPHPRTGQQSRAGAGERFMKSSTHWVCKIRLAPSLQTHGSISTRSPCFVPTEQPPCLARRINSAKPVVGLILSTLALPSPPLPLSHSVVKSAPPWLSAPSQSSTLPRCPSPFALTRLSRTDQPPSSPSGCPPPRRAESPSLSQLTLKAPLMLPLSLSLLTTSPSPV